MPRREMGQTPERRREKARERYRRWAALNRERLNANVRAYRARRYEKEGRWYDRSPKSIALAAFYAAEKARPCTDCGNTFPACCMDFDHRPGTKAGNVGSMVAHHYSIEKVAAEIAKCDLVCANCHRIRTRDRRTGSGKNRRAA